MKFLKNIVILFLLAGTAFIQSCSKCINSHGGGITQMRDVGGFSSVEFGTVGTIYVSQDSVTSIRIEAEQEIVDDMVTEINGGELNIYNRHCLHNPGSIIIHVTTPTLNGVTMSGSGTMYVTGSVNADHFDSRLAGSGDLHMQSIVTAATMSTTISGSGNIDLIAECSSMNSTISGSGNITISGSTSSQSLNISGSGSFFGYSFTSDTASVVISGNGNAEMFVNDLLNVTISGSGDVNYKGDAVVTSSISGNGHVNHVN